MPFLSTLLLGGNYLNNTNFLPLLNLPVFLVIFLKILEFTYSRIKQ